MTMIAKRGDAGTSQQGAHPGSRQDDDYSSSRAVVAMSPHNLRTA